MNTQLPGQIVSVLWCITFFFFQCNVQCFQPFARNCFFWFFTIPFFPYNFFFFFFIPFMEIWKLINENFSSLSRYDVVLVKTLVCIQWYSSLPAIRFDRGLWSLLESVALPFPSLASQYVCCGQVCIWKKASFPWVVGSFSLTSHEQPHGHCQNPTKFVLQKKSVQPPTFCLGSLGKNSFPSINRKFDLLILASLYKQISSSGRWCRFQ